MTSKTIRRIVFYSKFDGASGRNLEQAEDLLNSIDLNINFDINDLLEFYNIKLYFDNEMFLLDWNDSILNKYKAIIDNTWEMIKDTWRKFNDENILDHMRYLDYQYQKSFWQLVNYLQAYNQISNETFSLVLKEHPNQVHYILSHQKIVTKFDKEIRSFLIENNNSAELLLSMTQKSISDLPKYFFPKSLNDADKENIVSAYLDDENVNLNYVRLIENSKDSDIKLSPKTRLKAKKKSTELNNQILEKGSSVILGTQISISKLQDKPVEVSKEGQTEIISYSEKFLDAQTSNLALFTLFQRLFGFIDQSGLINLVNKESELDVLERFFTKSKNEYLNGFTFSRKETRAHLQILAFNYYIKQKGNSIEKLLNSVIEEYLNPYFKINKLQLKFPTENTTYLEKIRVLAPELEALLKQYQAYVTDGNIDPELLAIDSNPLQFSKVPSLMNKKYIYSDSDVITRLKYYFFSDQSGLYYLEKYANKYEKFYDLLIRENIELNDFADYQKDIISKLIEEGYLFINDSGNLKIKKEIMLSLIKELYENSVISYWHYNDNIRKVIDEMIDSKLFYFENTLFTKQELSYFNFYLNKKEFMNGLNLRNKYLHGSNGGSEKEHEVEYYILLRLIILALLKITDDLVLKHMNAKAQIIG